MFKELWFEDGYYVCGNLSESEVYALKNLHGLIVRENGYRV